MNTAEYDKQWNKENAWRRRGYNLKRRWRLTEAEVDGLIATQDGKCAICESVMTNSGIGSRRSQIDHDHVTGKFRGILCRHCNTGLGLFGDNPALLSKAIAYLAGIK